MNYGLFQRLTNNQAKLIVEEFKKRYDVSLIDDVVAYSHPYGCPN